MRAVVQRASQASVEVNGVTAGRLAGPGLVVLVGVTHADTAATAAALARKIYHLRILRDEKSCADTGAPLLVISQFTLYADTSKGRRPTWQAAAPGPVAEPLVTAFADALRGLGASVQTGVFGADMQVMLVNDGPVTLILDA
ncbi:MAG TPA: D-aminoacyl-tRNA deacylase [Streptosporangiaceae bacterium]|nr:D-aminoacyl-tRNA deacylase [Streptosporangiaceae bacterium]